MHIIFSILINLANLEQNLEKSGGTPTSQPANQANQDKQINLTRNFYKISKKFMPKYKNSLKLSIFKRKDDLFKHKSKFQLTIKRLNLEMKFTPNKAPKGFKISPQFLSNLAF